MSEADRKCHELAEQLFERFTEKNHDLFERVFIRALNGVPVAIHVVFDEDTGDLILKEVI